MKLYLAQCTTYDPEMDYPDKSVEILGIFSTPKLAEEAFTREEKRVDDGIFEHGKDVATDVQDIRIYTVKHQCFRGEHEVVEYDLDSWRGSPKTILSYDVGRHGEIKRIWRDK